MWPSSSRHDWPLSIVVAITRPLATYPPEALSSSSAWTQLASRSDVGSKLSTHPRSGSPRSASPSSSGCHSACLASCCNRWCRAATDDVRRLRLLPAPGGLVVGRVHRVRRRAGPLRLLRCWRRRRSGCGRPGPQAGPVDTSQFASQGQFAQALVLVQRLRVDLTTGGVNTQRWLDRSGHPPWADRLGLG